MIEQAIYQCLLNSETLALHLATYAEKPAIFYQKAPPDTDPLWRSGEQYGRVVFAVDEEGDPARSVGGRLFVDVFCETPETLKKLVRASLHGYFFTQNNCTTAAQWEDSRYFTPVDDPKISGVTLTFSLLAFPLLTTKNPDVITRLNDWTAQTFPQIAVIGQSDLPEAWKPDAEKAAVYWRVKSVAPAGWIPDTYQTIWRSATVKGHVFAENIHAAGIAAQEIVQALYRARRLVKPRESQIMVERNNTIDVEADALREGQITIEATYGQIVLPPQAPPLNHIYTNLK